METFPKDPFEMKARIVNGDERQVMSVLGRRGGLAGEGHGISVFG